MLGYFTQGYVHLLTSGSWKILTFNTVGKSLSVTGVDRTRRLPFLLKLPASICLYAVTCMPAGLLNHNSQKFRGHNHPELIKHWRNAENYNMCTRRWEKIQLPGSFKICQWPAEFQNWATICLGLVQCGRPSSQVKVKLFFSATCGHHRYMHCCCATISRESYHPRPSKRLSKIKAKLLMVKIEHLE
jgi:hypothetical protein